MNSTAVSTEPQGTTWGGGNQPLKSSYGKMMMWFFIVSDALTFSGFLAAYGFSRFKYIDYWPMQMRSLPMYLSYMDRNFQ